MTGLVFKNNKNIKVTKKEMFIQLKALTKS